MIRPPAVGIQFRRPEFSSVLGIPPGAMPEMENFDHSGDSVDTVVDQDWSVHKLADVAATLNRTADVREFLQEIDVI